MASEIEPKAAKQDIRRVAEKLGEPPSVAQYREHGRFSARGVANKFDGSFVKARDESGVSDGRLPEISRQDLLDDIRCVAELVGGEPSKGDYKEHGNYALSTITYRFESWVDAKQEAGVYSQENHGPTREMLIEDMQRVDDEIDTALSQRRYNEYGKYSTRPVKERFASWEDACQIAGVSRPKMGPRNHDTDALLEDIRRVADIVEHVPSKAEYNEHGEFSEQFALSRLGSWRDAVRQAGFEPCEPGGQPGERNGNWKGGYEPYYGPTWYPQRRKARDRDDYECQDCGKTDSEHLSEHGWELEVHHIIPAREFDDLEAANKLKNLITLCREHHREYEGLPASECEKLK